jgi:hypothetical protein
MTHDTNQKPQDPMRTHMDMHFKIYKRHSHDKDA